MITIHNMSDTDSRPLPTEGPSAGGGTDEFDDLFNYDADGGANDPFSENYMVPKTKEQREREEVRARREKGGDGLGLDEEVEVTRKPRAPRVKLDENRCVMVNYILNRFNMSPDSFRQTASPNSAPKPNTSDSKAKATNTPTPRASSRSTNSGSMISSPKHDFWMPSRW